uniref:Uncharacterized protein n=1 Tax=Echinococcus granulosus TaxID=6210 RepID=A0A068WM64_ECHGR|nr:hypothetical protein EgrG_000490000 [Echinococcus granulosus]
MRCQLGGGAQRGEPDDSGEFGQCVRAQHPASGGLRSGCGDVCHSCHHPHHRRFHSLS